MATLCGEWEPYLSKSNREFFPFHVDSPVAICCIQDPP